MGVQAYWMESFKNLNFMTLIKIVVASLLYFSVKDLGEIKDFKELIVAMLEFIIILEISKMVIEFMFGDGNQIKLRFMIDSTIIFFIRDIMLIVNDTFDVEKIFFALLIIAVLFLFRMVAMRYSPSRYERL